MATNADLLVKTLAEAGVKRIFSLSGNQIMVVYDACIDHGVEIVHVRHEGAAVFMAEATAQLSGEPAVALVTAGPGFANAMGALFSARSSDTPLLLLSGDSPHVADGRAAFQAMDQVAISSPVSKQSVRLQPGTDIAATITSALNAVKQPRSGPVHIAMPADVLEAGVDEGAAKVETFESAPAAIGDSDAQQLAQAIAAADQPLLITGPAYSRSRDSDLLSGLEQASGLLVVAMESPRGLKDPSLGSLSSLIGGADLIVCFGKRVDFSLMQGKVGPFSESCRWCVVDADRESLELAQRNLGIRLEMTFAANPRSALQALAKKDFVTLKNNVDNQTAWVERLSQALANRPTVPAVSDLPNSGTVCQAVQAVVSKQKKSILVCDGGEFGQWAQALTDGDVRITNGPSGAIGASICYATAAALYDPSASVFALMGDGTAGFHLSEFETAAREGAAFVAIIGNDQRWNAEHQIQLNSYGADRLIGCELGTARYDLAVAGLGGHGEYVDDIADLEDAIQRAVESGKPACVNVRIDGLPAPAGVPLHG